MKTICNCGAEFNSLQEYREHFLIGKPNYISESRLTRITAEMVQKRNQEIFEYEKLHSEIKNLRLA